MSEIEKKRIGAHAVEEEYKKLEKFQVNRRRIVLAEDDREHEGGYGIVRKAELHHSVYLPAWLASRLYGPPRLVAVKQIKISAASKTPKLKRSFTREVLVWSSLGAHPNVAKFLGFYADLKCSEAWLLSPWEPNGNVREFIHAYNLEVPEKLSLVYDTIDALDFLHQMNPSVWHGDIKSANVLVSANFKAILCDFGLAHLHEDSGYARLETSAVFKGSIRWCSPEVLNGEPRAASSDVYAWAWLVWEIMTGKVPYEESKVDFVVIRKIFESPLPQIDGESRLSDCLQVWELMRRCWNFDSLQRPSAKMCKTTITYLPRCTPAPNNVGHQSRSAPLLENLGDLESWKGNHAESFAYLNEALRLYQEEKNIMGVASVLRKQAAAAYSNTELVKVVATATAALEHFRSLNDALGIADASFWLGCSLFMQDKADEALPILRECLEIYRTHGNNVGAAHCLERIGEIGRCQIEGEKALSALAEAVAIASQSGDQLGVARALKTAGIVHRDLGNLVDAVEALSKARTVARNIGWERGLTDIIRHTGTIKRQLGEYRAAEELFQEAISVARQSKARWNLGWALEELAKCFQTQSRLDEAASAWEESFWVRQQLSRRGDSRRVASALIHLNSSQEKWNSALLWHDRIITVYRSLNQRSEVSDHLEEKGEILEKTGRFGEAALHFEAAIATRIESGSSWGLQRKRLCAIPKTVMKLESRWSLLCDVKKLQRRLPQLVTAILKLPFPSSHQGS